MAHYLSLLILPATRCPRPQPLFRPHVPTHLAIEDRRIAAPENPLFEMSVDSVPSRCAAQNFFGLAQQSSAEFDFGTPSNVGDFHWLNRH